MKKHGYVHRDLHSGNIACSQTNKKTIQLLNKSIPTFGYIYSVIDYGLITHKKFDLTIKEKKILSESSDVISIIYLTFENKVWNFVNKLMKRDKKFRIDFVSVFANFKKTTYFDMISKLTNHKELQMLLFELIFPEHHQIILLKEHYPGKYVKPYIKISFDDLLYMISHYDNPKKIADHFLSKLPKL
jgi:hypothetical protein